MSEPHDEERAAIAALWDGARERIAARMAAIDAAVAALDGASLREEERAEAKGEAHKLAGSLGTFGVPDGSRAARDLELLLDDAPTPADAPRATELASELHAAVDAGPAARADADDGE
jgi:HPt (histidine-containing phosphotransfer) domain-containing protein